MSLKKALLENEYKNGNGEVERYLKIHLGLMKYLDDCNLTIYFQYLVLKSNRHKVNKKMPGWFYIIPKDIEKDLPLSITEKSKRARLDKKLEKLGLIQTKVNKALYNNRKHYKINWKKIKKLSKEIEPSTLTNEKRTLKNEKTIKDTTNTRTTIKQYQQSWYTTLASPKQSSSDNFVELQGDVPLKYKRPDDLSRIISFWSSKGKPFARVKKISSAKKVLQKYITDDRIHLSLVYDSINVGHKICSNPDFIYTSNKSMSIREFFTPLKKMSVPHTTGYKQKFALLNNSKFKILDELLPERKKRSWFHLFFFKTPLELERALLHGIPKEDLEEDEYYQVILDCLPHLDISYEDLNTYETTKQIYKIARLMEKFSKKNDAPVLNDIIWYVESNPGIKLHYMLSKNFWNKQFGNYIVENLSRTDKINTI